MNKQVSRKELYNLIWKKPIMTIAAEYGFSDRGLGKLCEKYKIPVPPRGYWQKVKSGQKIAIPKLKSFSNIDDKAIILQPKTQDEISKIPDYIKELISYEKLPENKITVDYNTRKFHPIIEKWNKRDKFEKIKIDYKSRRILNSFVLSLEDRGYIAEENKERRNSVKIGTETDKVGVWVSRYTRTYKRTVSPKDGYKWKWRNSDDDYVFVSEDTNFYAIYVEGRYSYDNKRFVETDEIKIDALLSKCLIYIIKRLHSDKKRRLEREEYHRIQELQWQEEERRRELIKLEKEKVEKLMEDASKWKKAENIREYIEAVVKRSKDNNGELQQWAKWALDVANQLDPINNIQEDKQ